MKRLYPGCQALLLALLPLQAIGEDALPANGKPFQLLDYEQVSDLEQRAETYRDAYYEGRLDEACSGFEQLTLELNASRGLYLREWAMAELARGNQDKAKFLLLEAVDYSESMRVTELEKQALSKGGKEAVKVYAGDPYETSLTYVLLALIFLDEGDVDNALAACKSGILADSDASESLFESDLTLLYLLEARCHDTRGEAEAAQHSRDRAKASHQTTHESVRDLFTARLDYLELMKMSPKERKKLGGLVEDDAIRAEIDRLTAQIQQVSESIAVEQDLGRLYTGDYNLLLVNPLGMAPRKRQFGSMLEAVVFEPQLSAMDSPVIIYNHAELSPEWVGNIADIEFQALTRGGRRMDMILRGQASYKATTIGVGASILEAGNQIGGAGGLALALIGTIVQASGASVTPDADTRCWATLPKKFLLSPQQLPPGTQVFEFRHRLYYEDLDAVTREVELTGDPRELKVIWMPPEMAGNYSEPLFEISENRKQRPAKPAMTGQPILLVPPIMGMANLERIHIKHPDIKTIAIAPDPERLTKKVVEVFKQGGYDAVYMNHKEAMANALADLQPTPRAVQIFYRSTAVDQMPDKQELFEAEVEYRIIDLDTAKTVASRLVRAEWQRPKKDKTGIPEIFQQLVASTAETFLRDEKAAATLASSPD